jgi:hypothetical protein
MADEGLPPEAGAQAGGDVKGVDGPRQQLIDCAVGRAVDGDAAALHDGDPLVGEIGQRLLERQRIQRGRVVVAQEEIVVQMAGVLQHIVDRPRFAAGAPRPPEEPDVATLVAPQVGDRGVHLRPGRRRDRVIVDDQMARPAVGEPGQAGQGPAIQVIAAQVDDPHRQSVGRPGGRGDRLPYDEIGEGAEEEGKPEEAVCPGGHTSNGLGCQGVAA